MPEYDIEDIRSAAINSRITYRSNKVRTDIANLKMEFDDVRQTILKLDEKTCFNKTLYYDNGSPPDDSYRVNIPCPITGEGEITIYLKIKLIGKALSISLGSFHL